MIAKILGIEVQTSGRLEDLADQDLETDTGVHRIVYAIKIVPGKSQNLMTVTISHEETEVLKRIRPRIGNHLIENLQMIEKKRIGREQ